ncbi:hypothetical protein [Nocardioides sp. Soil805]|uniref:hypothetical protein n=1 Tax=Nocardioides sp. Soil805 TaxID=1736416 RepID=UPI0007024EE6|nr:hypothetical protein [Nocardioides sp. Soil805]KRF37498.1 hypothetical protein ASG94_09340 [Nocardioides sp. Soil805]
MTSPSRLLDRVLLVVPGVLVPGLLVPVLGAALVLTGPPAAASCAEPSAELADGSDLAFSGVVLDRSTSGGDPMVTVRVDRVFKGEVTRRVDVVSDASDDGYAIDADIDDEVVVFAQLVDDQVTSGLCTVVVGPGTYYDRVLEDLGPGTAPSEGYTQAERSGLTYDQWSMGRLVTGVLGLAVLGVVAWRSLRAWRARRASGAG